MAPESQSSTSSVQLCPGSVKPLQLTVLQLSAQPPVYQTATHFTSTQNETFPESAKGSERDQNLPISDQNHEFGFENDAQEAVFEPWVREWKDSSCLQADHPLSTRSIRCKPTFQIEPNTRQDSTYFSNKDPQEGALEDLNTVDELGYSPQESIKAAAESRKLTSSPPQITGADADDTGSEINAEILSKQMRERERVGILRGRVLRTRRIVKSQRSELQKRREDVAVAIDRLTRKIIEPATLNAPGDIFSYHEALRAALDRLGPMEEEYDGLEIRLENEELDLEEEEDYFYRHYDASLMVPESKLDTIISPRLHTHVPTQKEVTNFDLQDRQMQEYFEKVADATRLKEELDKLESKFSRLSEDADFRRRHSILVSLEVSNFFEEYSGLHAEYVRKILKVEEEISELRDLCLGQGLFTDDEYLYELYGALCEEWMEPVYYTQERSPLRLAARLHNQLEWDLDYEDKMESVNNWLLEWIQASAVHILMLKADIFFYFPQNYDATGSIFNIENWADLALDHWHTDGAGEFANSNYNASRLDQITGSLHKTRGRSTITSKESRKSRYSDYRPGSSLSKSGADGSLVRTNAGSHSSTTGLPGFALIKRRFSI